MVSTAKIRLNQIRVIAGAYRSGIIAELENETSIEVLDIHLQRILRGYVTSAKDTKADIVVVGACDTTARNARARYRSTKTREPRYLDAVRQNMQQRVERHRAVELVLQPQQSARAEK